jgi:hypothetical protein
MLLKILPLGLPTPCSHRGTKANLRITILGISSLLIGITQFRYSSLPHSDYMHKTVQSINELNEKYGFNRKNKKQVKVKGKFDQLDQDFKKLLHRDAKFAKIWQNEEKYERQLLGNKYLSNKMRMSIEDREFEVYKKYVNWVRFIYSTD